MNSKPYLFAIVILSAIIIYFSLFRIPPAADIFGDKSFHLSSYLALGWFYQKAIGKLLLASYIPFAFGIVIELLQIFAGRGFFIGDIAINAIGIFIGVSLPDYRHGAEKLA